MGDENECDSRSLRHLVQQPDDFPPRGGVEIPGGLIAQQQVRPGAERAGDCHALLLPAGELSGIVGQPVPQAKPVDHRIEIIPIRLFPVEQVTIHLDNEAHPTVQIALYRYDGEQCLAVIDGTPVSLVPRSPVVDLIEAVNAIVL